MNSKKEELRKTDNVKEISRFEAPDMMPVDFVQNPKASALHTDPIFFMDGKVSNIPNANATAREINESIWESYLKSDGLYGSLNESTIGPFLNNFVTYYDWEMAGNITVLLINSLWDSVYRIFGQYDIFSNKSFKADDLRANLLNICKSVLDYKEIENHFLGMSQLRNIRETIESLIMEHKSFKPNDMEPSIRFAYLIKDKMTLFAVSYFAHYANILANRFANEMMHGEIHPSEGLNAYSSILRSVANYSGTKDIDRNLIHAALNAIFYNYSFAFAGIVEKEITRMILNFLKSYPEHFNNVATIAKMDRTDCVNYINNHNCPF